MVPAPEFLSDYFGRVAAGWAVNFSSAPSAGLPDTVVRVPASNFVVGFAWGGGAPAKSLWVPPALVGEGYARTAAAARPRGMMYYDVNDAGKGVNGTAAPVNFAREFNAFLHVRPAPRDLPPP